MCHLVGKVIFKASIKIPITLNHSDWVWGLLREVGEKMEKQKYNKQRVCLLICTFIKSQFNFFYCT